ncbi:MAG: phosphoenolpyruvate carboxykinase (GTP) [Sedimentisphaerales bacterium]|nr:phosphoenolpyruvate carboxykinase (GTP) [Sedimentisphaerales bacterium]
MDRVNNLLKERLNADGFGRLTAIGCAPMHAFVADAIELCNPDSIFVCTDDPADQQKIREMAKNGGGEHPLAMEGHTYHFDGPQDQGRDKEVTKYLLAKGVDLGESLNSMDKTEGTGEIRSLLKNSMVGRQMLICFWCLGPVNSEFSISCIQITDSPYVAHSEALLYRPGYEQFKKVGANREFFKFLHSQGELDTNGCSKNVPLKRIYIDLEENIVYSTNTQYAGNTVGLKKLALRLAIQKASREGWLAEHMFVMGVHGPNGRVTYFNGAFPSACGKTSTAMIPGQTIVGDDIAYLRKSGGKVYTANVEQGIFGIIENVNPKDDPVIYEAITRPGEVIFGNVLITDGKPYWMGMGCEIPDKGVNFSGLWHKGKKDAEGKDIPPSHKNARYTVRISALANRDSRIDDPTGVPLGAIVYGGRDSDTLVPVEQAFDWTEGIIAKGAALESETTAATLGKEGVRTFNIMSNQDFVSIPLGRYIQNNLDFAKGMANPPAIFSVNYFLRGADRKFLHEIPDKAVWILWAELRTNGDVDAIQTPTGYIPLYKDIARLFRENLHKEFTEQDYLQAFTVRIPNLLAKFDRVEKIYRTKVPDTPPIVYDTFAVIQKRLKEAQAQYGDNISPLTLQ